MAGLLDMLGGLSPEQNQGLLAAAAQMLQAGGPSRVPVGMGQALGAGLQAYQQTTDGLSQRQQMHERQAAQDQQVAQMRELQMAGMRQSQSLEAEEAARAKLPAPAKPVSYSMNPEWMVGKDGKPQAVVMGSDGQPKVLEGFRPYVPPSRAASSGAGSRAGAAAPADKPLPTSALKMLVSEEDALATASGIQQELGRVKQQITDGTLTFGLASNALNTARNFIGKSTEESRNFASFRATLEKLRNDSLRLNAGVQTDGDAKRAWNELFANINDKEYVSQRLAEIEKINERAIAQRQANIGTIQGNYSKPAAAGVVANPTQPRAKNVPMKGQVKNGYRYIGGEPSDPASWEKI